MTRFRGELLLRQKRLDACGKRTQRDFYAVLGAFAENINKFARYRKLGTLSRVPLVFN